MFAWEFYRSAEALFSRLAAKRVLRFLLKKKLGDYILGDIDLDQLDVQLRQGTAQLTDLALNVDFLNAMLGTAPVVIREGSIASLLVRVPWGMKDWQIEVEELELVLAPNGFPRDSTSVDNIHMKVGHNGISVNPQKHGENRDEDSSYSASNNVHEGVKTVAKFVKKFLTSFHVRLKSLIIAFDPGSDAAGNHPELSRILVFRIADIEFGTCISEDKTDTSSGNILGISRLMNSVKFQGAMVEFLEINNTDSKKENPSLLGRSFIELCADNSSPLVSTTKILGGPVGGFSGVLDLSIPWKNGCLDIPKLSAEIAVDPIHVLLLPSTIMWMVSLQRYLGGLMNDCTIPSTLTKESGFCSFHDHPKGEDPSLLSGEMITSAAEINRLDLVSPIPFQKSISDDLHPSPHVIQNWVPLPVDYTTNFEAEYDYEASIDQFFESFDVMRSSQASSGSSGIWNLACSVFTVITAASNLASDSLHIPPEQQNVEANLKATVAAISVVLLFDSDSKQPSEAIRSEHAYDMWGTQYMSFISTGQTGFSANNEDFQSCMSNSEFICSEQSNEANLRRNDMHILNILCSKLTFAFQIFPQCTKFGAEVQHIKIVDHFVEGQAVGNNLLHCINDFTVQTHMVQQFQICVQDALPPFSSVTKDEKAPDASGTANFHPVIPSADTSVHSVLSKIFPLHESCSVTLLESFGNCSVEYFASYTNSGVKTTSSTSFSLKLPPFIFWLDIQLVNTLLSFFNQIESSIQTINSMKAPAYCAEEMDLSTDRDVKNEKQVSPFSSKNLQGNIMVSSARIILCLDLDKKHCSQVYHWDTYISIDIRGVSSDKVDIAKQNSSSCGRGVSNSDYMSISLYSGTIDVHLVSAASKSDYGSNLQPTVGSHYCSKRIISASHQPNNHHATVCLIWQKDPVIDLQMAWKVQNVVNSKNSRNGNNNLGSEQDVAFVRTAAEESETPLRQELIQSSSFLTHIRFSFVSANLSNNEYVKLHGIITKVLDSLHIEFDSNDVAGKRFQSDGTTRGSNNQMSIFVEFNHVDLSMTLDVIEDASKLLQRELPGSWTSLGLEVEKFELLSVTNVGGIADASFFGVSHGEGDLWGSISSMNKGLSSSSASNMFLLISCKNSVLGRGDGVGGNATSSGSAGTSVMYFKNPQACCLFTSAVVRCGTIVAPGCRLDWFETIVTFFRLPCSQEAGDFSEGKTLSGDLQYKTSFYLDLIDVALSYEPHITANGALRIGDMNITNQNHVACIVAASSFGFCQIAEDIPNDNYNIRLHDLGLLICNTKDSNSDKRYDVEHLRKLGYVKIASDAAMSAIVRSNCDKDLWEVEFSGLNVKMDTCGDTTVGLVCLLCQFQQLFAPDIDDALVHLLSRWNSTQRAQEADKQSADVTESDMGIMDEVADGIIFHQSEKNIQSNHCDLQKEILNDKESVREPPEMNVICSGNSILCSVSSVGLEQDILQDSSQPQCRDRICMPEIMEGYYVTDKLPREKISSASFSQEVPNIPANTSPQPVSEKNGWYNNNSLIIVENYLSITSDQHLEKQVIDQKDISVHSFPTGTCKPSGRIILKHSDVRWRMLGGLDWPNAERNSSQSSKSGGRDQNACLELHLIGLNLRHDMYPEGELMVSNLSLTLQDFSLCDYSLNAPWKMVLGYYHSKQHPRESSAKALKLDLESVRLNPAIPLEEYRLQLAILPVRLHLDQSQLDFLVSFFSSVSISESANGGHSLNQQLHSEDKSCDNAYIPNDALLPFFQKCDIWPIIMRIDYIPRYVNVAALRRGNYTELINLVSWKGIDLHLKHVHGVGIYGWGGICEAVGGEWLEDISKNQVHKLLKGLKPVSSLFSVGSGAAKLVSLPVKDYTKDRKLVKGIQRGVVSFIRSISIETVGLGVHLAGEVHDILLKTECALAGSPQLLSSSEKKTSGIRSNQPKDVHQGIQQAYESLSDGIGRTASALVGNPLRTFQRGAGAGSAFASVIRAAPAAAVAPASSAARAVHCALLGVRNSLDPEHKKDSMEKYHGSSDY